MAGENRGQTDADDPHARPTTALAADEMRRLVGRGDDTPARIAKASESVRSERLDIATTEMDPAQLGALLAAEPRRTPAVIARRADTQVDPAPTDDDLAVPVAPRRTSRPRQQLARLPTLEPLRHPDGGRDHTGLVLLVVAIAMAAVAAIIVLR